MVALSAPGYGVAYREGTKYYKSLTYHRDLETARVSAKGISRYGYATVIVPWSWQEGEPLPSHPIG